MDRFVATSFGSATEITSAHFGVVLKSSAVPALIDNSRDWGLLSRVILESGATSIRFPGGTEGWRDFDFTNQVDVERLKAIIDFCSEMNLTLQFTVSLRQFFVEPLDSDADGVLMMNDRQRASLAEFVKRDLLDYAESKGVIVSNIQLDNEPLHRDLDGEFLNHREYGYLANEYAEIIGPIIDQHTQSPTLSVVTAADEGRFNSAGEIVYGGAWGIRPIINGFNGGVGAQYIDSIDLHMGDVTLHPEYEDVFGTDESSAPYLGSSLYDGLTWQQHIWGRDTAYVGWGADILSFQVSAWSLPQASDGGGSLQNAMLAVYQMHAYSATGIESATNYTIIGGDANALFSFGGRARAGGLIFKMMADALEGLTAIKLEPTVTNSERLVSDTKIEGFLGQDKMVVYVANSLSSTKTMSIDFSDLVDESSQFDNGISSISGRILGIVEGADPLNPYSEAILVNWLVDPKNFSGMSAEFTLDSFQIIEFTIEVNSLDFVSVSDVLLQDDLQNIPALLSGSVAPLFSSGSVESVYKTAYAEEISFLSASAGITVWSGLGLVEMNHDLIELNGAVRIQGSLFADRMVFTSDGGFFYGEGGDDIIEFRVTSNNYASGGAGNDRFLFYDSFGASVSGGSGDDSFHIFNFGGHPADGRVTFEFSNGDGHDTIRGFDPLQDELIFRGIDRNEVVIQFESRNAVLSVGDDCSVTLVNLDATMGLDFFTFL